MRIRLCRGLLVLAGLAAAWSVVVAVTGGFVLRLGTVQFSSRRWQGAALAGLVSVVAAWAIATAEERRAAWRRLRDWRQWPRWVDAALLVALVGAAVRLALWSAGRPLWLDEEMIALNIRDRGFAELGGALWLAQTAPLGWLLLERALFVTCGGGELALRAVPLAFGIGTLFVALWAGFRWLNRFGSTALMSLFAFGPWLLYNSVELKPYSADAFWGLLLPVLAAWALEAPSGTSPIPGVRHRRVLAWWITAAIGQWFANGAMLVTPGCAAVIGLVSLHREGWPGLWRAALPGVAWLASFGLHYALSIRHALASDFLAGHWAFAMPPASAGVTERVAWLGGQIESLAVNPGGSRLWLPFWLSVAVGVVLAPRPLVGALLAAVPLAAFALAALRLVPLYERLSLWMLPALYAGIGLLASRGFTWTANAGTPRRWVRSVAGVAAMATAAWVSADVVHQGADHLHRELPRDAPPGNHDLDDRAAVDWLLSQRQPGDVVITTKLALPAIWWYGGASMSNATNAGRRLADGTPVLEVGFAPWRVTCSNEPGAALAGYRRALLYLGFRFDDVPKDFDDRLLGTLEALGPTVAAQQFSTAGRTVIVELLRTGAGRAPSSAPPSEVRPPGALGCLTVRDAGRW